MPKIMPKFDAEKKLERAILAAIWIHVGDAGGKGAGRFWLLLSVNAMTPAGVGGFWLLPGIQNGSKIAPLSIDRRLDPPKMTSGRGLEQNKICLVKNRCGNLTFLMA